MKNVGEPDGGRINFVWYKFIAKTKLGCSEAECNFLSIGEFSDLYYEYKNVFDLEMSMLASSTAICLQEVQQIPMKRMITSAEEREEIINF